MALRISFKPGMEQSQQAAQYFHGAVGTLVEGMIEGLQQRTYMIRGEGGPSLKLLTWCAKDLNDAELHELMDWLLELRDDIRLLNDDPNAPDHPASAVTNWLAERMGGADLFVELSLVHPELGGHELLEFSLGMVRGRSVMVSTDTLLFTWLDEHIFGLTLAGHGSYLLELEDDTRTLRKAS